MGSMTIAKGINNGLRAAMERDPKVVLMGEDIGKLGGVFRVTDGLQKDFGEDRVIDTPLAEAGIVGDALRTLDQFGRRKHERTPAELLAELYDTWRGVAAALSEGEQVARETWRMEMMSPRMQMVNPFFADWGLPAILKRMPIGG